MKRKFLQDISANSLQVIINQLCGLGIFYVLSTQLDKNNFGEINWSLAVLLTLFGILACGIDQVTVRRIASGHDAKNVLSVYIAHVVLSGIFAYTLLLSGKFIFPSFFQKHSLLLLLGIGKLMIFFSTPFKQLATGMEKFRPLLYMAISSNILRGIALILLAILQQVNLEFVIIIFIFGDLAELLVCILITQFIIKVPVTVRWNQKAYKSIIKESLPQLGVAVFTAVITRFDWILLGLISSNIILANYSFAYKIFEMATLPMLVLAPLLIPRFTRIFNPGTPASAKLDDIFVLLRIEMMIASLVALLLNIIWVPLIDLISFGKYGAVNHLTILLLSATMPFLYLNNFLWTINFAKGHLKMIFYNYAFTFLVNIIANIILIPLYNAEGAAIAYLITIICQSVFYFMQAKPAGPAKNYLPVLICPACAFAAGLVAKFFFTDVWAQLVSGCVFFGALLILTRQLRLTDGPVIKRVTGI